MFFSKTADSIVDSPQTIPLKFVVMLQKSGNYQIKLENMPEMRYSKST